METELHIVYKVLNTANTTNLFCRRIFFPSVALRSYADHGLLILEVSRSHTMKHYTRQDSSGRVISSSQRPLPNNMQQAQQTNIQVPGGIRTHNVSRRSAAELRLRPCGHWNRRGRYLILCGYIYHTTGYLTLIVLMWRIG